MQTFIVKFAGAFSGFVSGVGLTMIGWKAGVTPGAATVLGMRVIMIAIPALLSMLCCVMYKAGYRLTGEFYDKMVKELRSRKERRLKPYRISAMYDYAEFKTIFGFKRLSILFNASDYGKA